MLCNTAVFDILAQFTQSTLSTNDQSTGMHSFLQCYDTVGLVMWPVKIVPEMTYVLTGTLSLYTALPLCVMTPLGGSYETRQQQSYSA